MPGLFLPRLRPTDAVDARQIDRCVQAIAEVLNGGLTRDNVGPFNKLFASDFTENRSIVALKAFVGTATIDGSNNAVPLFGVTPRAASLVGFGYCLKADSFPVTGRRIDIMGGAAGATLIYRHELPLRDLPVSIQAVNYLIGFVQPRTPETIAANDVLRLLWPTVAGTTPVGSVTLFLSVGWV